MENEPVFKLDDIETFTGRAVNLVDFRSEMIDIRDIAHSLSNIGRYCGHARKFYSVAEHTVVGSRLIRMSLARPFMTHDMSESYYGDISRPLKGLLPGYKQLEVKAQRVIEIYFLGEVMTEREHAEVKLVDNAMLVAEARALLPSRGRNWQGTWGLSDESMALAKNITIQCWTPEEAERRFLEQWDAVQ